MKHETLLQGFRFQVSGFTIIELLVVAGIIVLMAALVVPAWKSGEKTLALDRVVHKAGQDVRRTQELAMRAQPYTCSTGTIFAYGIFFDTTSPTSYLIFAECDQNSIGYNAGTDGVVETISLENNVQIVSVSPSSQMSVVFVPPTPTVFLKPGDPSLAQVSFQRTDSQGTPKVLDISSKGIIDVN